MLVLYKVSFGPDENSNFFFQQVLAAQLNCFSSDTVNFAVIPLSIIDE